MIRADYRNVVAAEISPDEALERIGRVNEWWTRSFTGSARNVGDTFGVRFGETSVDFEVVERIPGKRVAWRVTDCHLPWLRDTTEWTATTIAFDIVCDGTTSTISMTHTGLTPAEECWNVCEDGWNFYVGESLRGLLVGGEGRPDGRARHT